LKPNHRGDKFSQFPDGQIPARADVYDLIRFIGSAWWFAAGAISGGWQPQSLQAKNDALAESKLGRADN
jgi:hypothetical protein